MHACMHAKKKKKKKKEYHIFNLRGLPKFIQIMRILINAVGYKRLQQKNGKKLDAKSLRMFQK